MVMIILSIAFNEDLNLGFYFDIKIKGGKNI